jgi:hypothetical protein
MSYVEVAVADESILPEGMSPSIRADIRGMVSNASAHERF